MDQSPPKKRKGYMTGYQASLDRMEHFKQRECARLSQEWSQTERPAGPAVCRRCGRPAPVRAYDHKRTVTTKFGEVEFTRNYHYCEKCGEGFYPRDEELGLEEDLTDDLQAAALDMVMNAPYEAAAARIKLHHGVEISATGLKHLFERKAAAQADAEKPRPVVPLPLTDSNAHRPVLFLNDGSMIRQKTGWHEVKLMRVQVHGETDSVYLAETRDKDRFESLARESPGFWKLRTRTVLWIADGAAYNWGLKQRLVPHGRELLDFWHAMEHAHETARELFGEGDPCVDMFAGRISDLLLSGNAAELLDELKECIPYRPKTKTARKTRSILVKLLNYYSEHRGRMSYREFLDNGRPIGSGAIESAHKHVLQRRMKLPGMSWSSVNAQRMATMLALYSSVGPLKFFDYLDEPERAAA